MSEKTHDVIVLTISDEEVKSTVPVQLVIKEHVGWRDTDDTRSFAA